MTRTSLFLLAAMFAVPSVMAQDADPISTDAIYACAKIATDAERLACYDDTVGRFEAAEAAGEVTTISKSEVEELKKDSFGFALPSIPKIVMPKFGNDDSNDLETITIAVTEVERLRYDNLRVTLENGQIWEQTDGKRVQFSKRLGVDSAIINRGRLGAIRCVWIMASSFG